MTAEYESKKQADNLLINVLQKEREQLEKNYWDEEKRVLKLTEELGEMRSLKRLYEQGVEEKLEIERWMSEALGLKEKEISKREEI